MSAFMVADDTINRVVYWISREVTESRWFKEKVEHELSIDTSKEGWEKELGKAMFQLNIDGVNSRYGDGEAPKFRPLNYIYSPAFVSEIQVLKSLNCWLYQCAEGNVPEKPLYIAFDTVIKSHLMSSIIFDLPAYNIAEWD